MKPAAQLARVGEGLELADDLDRVSIGSAFQREQQGSSDCREEPRLVLEAQDAATQRFRRLTKRGEIHKRYREGQEDQLGALGLVTNAVILWNTCSFILRGQPNGSCKPYQCSTMIIYTLEILNQLKSIMKNYNINY